MLVCCQAAEKACDTGCRKCSDFWSTTCEALCPVDKPSPLFTIFAVGMSLGLIIASAVHLAGDSGKSCSSGSCTAWWACIIIMSLINFVFTWHVYVKFKQALEKGERACKSASRFLCYDIGCYLYMFIIVWMIVWICIPGTMCSEELVCTSQKNTTVGTILLGVYLGCGAFIFMMSTCTQCYYEDPQAAQRNAANSDQLAYAAMPSPVVMGGGGGGSNPLQNNNSSYNNNNNSSYQQPNKHHEESSSSSTSMGTAVAKAVASTAVSVTGNALKSIGNSLLGGGSKKEQQNTNNNNNNQYYHSDDLTPPPPQPQAAYVQPQSPYQQQQPPPTAQPVTMGYVSTQPAAQGTALYQQPTQTQPQPQQGQPQWGGGGGGNSAQPQW